MGGATPTPKGTLDKPHIISPVAASGKYLKLMLKNMVLDTYSKEARPKDGSDSMDLFSVALDITKISSFSYAQNSFVAAGYLIMKWKV